MIDYQNRVFTFVSLAITASTLPSLAYESENVTYDVSSFAALQQHFPASYLVDYPDRNTLIPEPTAKLANLEAYTQGNNPQELTLFARVCRPEGAQGALPTVVVAHGSGGLWPENEIGNDMQTQFEDWAVQLTQRGYMAIFPDSYNPRGIPEDFHDRRPHIDPSFDSDSCSPQFDRPRDILATLDYLATRGDVELNKVSIVGFSQGSEAIYNAFNDVTVQRNVTSYTISRYEWDSDSEEHVAITHNYSAPSPVRIPLNHPAYPKFIALYYPGCHSWGYNGKYTPHSNEYYPSTAAKFALFHGTNDALYQSSGYQAFIDRIALHGMANMLPTEAFAYREAYVDAEHGFDWKALSNNASVANAAAYTDARDIVYAELELVADPPVILPGKVHVFGKDILAPGLFFHAKAKYVYDLYRKEPNGRLKPIIIGLKDYSGCVAIPLIHPRDNWQRYVLDYGFAEREIRETR